MRVTQNGIDVVNIVVEKWIISSFQVYILFLESGSKVLHQHKLRERATKSTSLSELHLNRH